MDVLPEWVDLEEVMVEALEAMVMGDVGGIQWTVGEHFYRVFFMKGSDGRVIAAFPGRWSASGALTINANARNAWNHVLDSALCVGVTRPSQLSVNPDLFAHLVRLQRESMGTL